MGLGSIVRSVKGHTWLDDSGYKNSIMFTEFECSIKCNLCFCCFSPPLWLQLFSSCKYFGAFGFSICTECCDCASWISPEFELP